MGFFAYMGDQSQLRNKVVDNLSLNHQLSISDITDNMKSLKNEIELISDNSSVVNFCKKNESIIETNDKEFEKWAQECVTHFGFYDLFIINVNGDVIYSVTREDDLGTNLVAGKYNKSGLARLFANAVTTKKFSGSDFSVYKPSNNELAGFIGQPIFEEGELIGVIAIQLPTSFERLNIGVHIENIEDYIITTNYIFQHNGGFRYLDSVNFYVPNTPMAGFRGDSLYVFTPFETGEQHWGILSIAPPLVFNASVSWDKIWLYSLVSILCSLLIWVFIIRWITKRREFLVFAKIDILLVQQTWQQLINKKHAFGTDFYYRIKNKIGINLVENESSIEEFGQEIELRTSEIINCLGDEIMLIEKLSSLALGSPKVKYSILKLQKLPTLFIESLEDEMGEELPLNANLAFNKIIRSLVIRFVGLSHSKLA